RPGGAVHERLPRLEQGRLGLAHGLRLVAADHRGALPSAASLRVAAPAACPGTTAPGSRSATTIAVATSPSCERDRCRWATLCSSAARSVAPRSRREGRRTWVRSTVPSCQEQ